MCWHCATCLVECEVCKVWFFEQCGLISDIDVEFVEKLRQKDIENNDEDGDNGHVANFILEQKPMNMHQCKGIQGELNVWVNGAWREVCIKCYNKYENKFN